jgi:hypothetical protein
MRQITWIFTASLLTSIALPVAAQSGPTAGSYCPVYAESNWRLSWVEETVHAWLDKGSKKFDDHLNYCKDIFRNESDPLAVLRDEWSYRHDRIVNRMQDWKAGDMVAYMEAWDDVGKVCDWYANFNQALSEVSDHLGTDTGSLEAVDHKNYCVNSIYRNQDNGLQVQQEWDSRFASVMQLLAAEAPR